MTTYDLTVTFTEPMLGTAPLNEQLYTDYIATKRGANGNGTPLTQEELEEELGTLLEDKGRTGFHRCPDGTPMIYDYIVKGYFKDACKMRRYDTGSLSKTVRAYRQMIDGLLFVTPRRIPLRLAGPLEILERPLRAQTMQGERVALAQSEMVPAGTMFDCQIHILGSGIDEALLREWLDYGQWRGIGQWRNASWGTFQYTLTRQR